MFNHSIKVPRLYKLAAKYAKEASDNHASVKQLVYQKKHPVILFEVSLSMLIYFQLLWILEC